jgi:NAD(P)-dependent dehydrogenase (short-subunit alcohol dehydrogenase family)
MKLEGKVAIVTGGARGIGAGIARSLAAEGARLALLDVDVDEAQKTASELGTDSIGVAADVSTEAAAIDATAKVVAHFGGLDVFVNNAGAGKGDPRDFGGLGNPFTNITQEGWDGQIENNLRTTFAGCKAAIPHLEKRGGGSIVNIASIAGLLATPALPAYGAAKAGVIALSRSLALELGPKNIRVNAICPGFLWTRAWEMLATLMKMGVPEYASLEPREIFLDQVKRGVPLGREQTPDDIGALTAFLCGDGARNITGQAISVDGGITLKVGVAG